MTDQIFLKKCEALIFRQFCTRDDEISYLRADPVTCDALLQDSHLHVEHDYLDILRKLDLRLVYLIETHAHESHLSAASVMRAAMLMLAGCSTACENVYIGCPTKHWSFLVAP